MLNRFKILLRAYLIVTSIIFVFQTTADGMTRITGTVTAKRNDSVKIEYKPHKNVGPKVGDKVDFKVMMKGLEVNAGQGEVTNSESGSAWVKVKKGRPRANMTGIIYATGKPWPIDYVMDLPGIDIKTKSVHFWNPGASFSFKFTDGLKFSSKFSPKIKNKHEKIYFPGGALLSSSPEVPRGGILKTHQLTRSTFYDNSNRRNSPDSDFETKYQFIWKDRIIRGQNTVFIVSQIIKITKSKDFSYVEREQSFLVTAEANQSSTNPDFTEMYWTIRLVNYGDYNPAHWKNIFLDIFQSASIELK